MPAMMVGGNKRFPVTRDRTGGLNWSESARAWLQALGQSWPIGKRPTSKMGRTNADIDVFLHLLRQRGVSARHLSAALRALGVPRSTYYYWKKQLSSASASPTGVVRRLQQETRVLTGRVKQLEMDLALAREALGKPWRRWLPGGPPSAGR